MSRLRHTASPYLQQHAKNPIDWFPWGEEAFIAARASNKPIFLSVGYFTCYWCHVMDADIFMDPDIARLLNDSFIAIKVDREVHPDVDEVYMAARQLITNKSGWPNHVFLTSDGHPFMAAGVLAKDRRYGVSFGELLERVAENWQAKETEIRDGAAQIHAHLMDRFDPALDSTESADGDVVDLLYTHFKEQHDAEFGGFYGEPKFPRENYLLFLLEEHAQRHDVEALRLAVDSLEKIASSPLYDHVGGGFHRYANDRAWLSPHFEKLLPTQALMARCYVNAYHHTRKPFLRDIAERTLEFVIRELVTSDGVFQAAVDAETDGIEGAYYGWTEQELGALLRDPSHPELFRHYLRLSEPATEPGHAALNAAIIHSKTSPSPLAAMQARTFETTMRKLRGLLDPLLTARNRRTMPEIDHKIITGWNGLMIETLAHAGMLLDEPRYTDLAATAATHVLTHARLEDGRLARLLIDGSATCPAYLEDYAFLEAGCLELFESTKDRRWLDNAVSLQEAADLIFWDERQGGYFFNDGQDSVIPRIRSVHDDALPSCSGAMCDNLLRLFADSGDRKWKTKASRMMEIYGNAMRSNPTDYVSLIQATMRIT